MKDNPENHGAWIPWATGAVIIILFALALLFPGYWTWPFNSIAYLPRVFAIVFTLGCAVVPLLLNRRYSRLEKWMPSRKVGMILILLLAALCAAGIAVSRVYLPELEGDGNIGHAWGGWRIRPWLVREIMAPLFQLAEKPAALLSWKVLGIIYILGGVVFVSAVSKRFWERWWGLALLCALPPIVNFTGHYDSYPVTYLSVSLFLALCFLAAVKKSCITVIGALSALVISFFAHRLALAALLYPAFYLLIQATARFPRRRLTMGIFMLMIVLAGIFAARLGLQERFGCGSWFVETVKIAGYGKTALVPFLLMSSFLIPYLYLLGVLLVDRSSRRLIAADPISATVVMGSVVIVILYYCQELLTLGASYGVLEYVARNGQIGSLFSVPLLIVITRCFRRYLPSFVFLAAFITLPTILVHRGPASLTRMRVFLPDQLEYAAQEDSSYHLGVRVFFAGVWNKRPELFKIGCEILEQGVEDTGYYKSFAPINLYHAVLFRYGIGDREKAMNNLERLLRRWPRTSLYLLGESWGVPQIDPGLDGFDWRASSVRTHQYWQSQILPEADRILAELAWKTKEPLYEAIRKNLINRRRKDRQALTSAQVRAAVFALSDIEPEETNMALFTGDDAFSAIGEE